jgi:hypothetical protein
MATMHFDKKPRLTPEQDTGGLTNVGWLLLMLGLLEIPVGVLALATPVPPWQRSSRGSRSPSRSSGCPADVGQSFGSAVSNGHAQAPADAGRAAATT